MCNCIEEVNKRLAEMQPDNNTELDIPFSFGMSGKFTIEKVRICTTKRDTYNRKKPMSIQAAYCPFCGEAYESEQIVTNL